MARRVVKHRKPVKPRVKRNRCYELYESTRGRLGGPVGRELGGWTAKYSLREAKKLETKLKRAGDTRVRIEESDGTYWVRSGTRLPKKC
jgi:hypothetical protein